MVFRLASPYLLRRNHIRKLTEFALEFQKNALWDTLKHVQLSHDFFRYVKTIYSESYHVGVGLGIYYSHKRTLKAPKYPPKTTPKSLKFEKET